MDRAEMQRITDLCIKSFIRDSVEVYGHLVGIGDDLRYYVSNDDDPDKAKKELD